MSTTFLDFLRDSLISQNAGFRAGRWVALAKLAWQVRRERNALAEMTAEQLADIGVHPKVAEREAKREMFDLPKARVDRLTD